MKLSYQFNRYHSLSDEERQKALKWLERYDLYMNYRRSYRPLNSVGKAYISLFPYPRNLDMESNSAWFLRYAFRKKRCPWKRRSLRLHLERLNDPV